MTARLKVFTTAVALALASGCRGGTDPFGYQPGPALDGPRHRGGHIVFVREEDPDYLDPALSYGVYSPADRGGVPHAARYADAPGPAGARLVPELAETLPDVREGGTLYAFKVRADARFGAPLHRHITAADFKYAIRAAVPGRLAGRDLLPPHRRRRAPCSRASDSTLAGRDRARRLALLPAHASRTRSSSSPDRDDVHRADAARGRSSAGRTRSRSTPSSSGPYEVAEYVPRRRVLLVRNPDYCGAPALARHLRAAARRQRLEQRGRA